MTPLYKPKLYPSAADFTLMDTWAQSKIYYCQPGIGLVYKTVSRFSMDFIH